MYIELHSRSAFSFLEGASLPEEMAGVCAERGMPAMALLDRDGVYGAPRFHQAAKKAGLKAHIGAEIQFRASNSAFENQDSEVATTRLPLLAASRAGYQSLCRLVTRMKMRGPKDALPETFAAGEVDLREHATGLICLTGGDDGPLAAALARGGIEEGRRAAERLIEIFGRENVYVELQRHFLREEEARNRAVLEIARSLRLPIIATNGVRHATVAEREILDVFTCIR